MANPQRVALGAVCLLLAAAVVSAADPESDCIPLSENNFVDRDELRDFNYKLDARGYYFCSGSAPKQFYCGCGISAVCVEKLDPWGRDLGECVSPSAWLSAVIVLFLTLLGLSVLIAIYGCMCRGRWWCDGYPRPITPVLARRGAPVVVPASVPLPSNIFRGYRSSDFDSGLPPGAAEELARQRAARRARRQSERARRRERRARAAEGGAATGTEGAGESPAEGGNATSEGDSPQAQEQRPRSRSRPGSSSSAARRNQSPLVRHTQVRQPSITMSTDDDVHAADIPEVEILSNDEGSASPEMAAVAPPPADEEVTESPTQNAFGAPMRRSVGGGPPADRPPSSE